MGNVLLANVQIFLQLFFAGFDFPFLCNRSIAGGHICLFCILVTTLKKKPQSSLGQVYRCSSFNSGGEFVRAKISHLENATLK